MPLGMFSVSFLDPLILSHSDYKVPCCNILLYYTIICCKLYIMQKRIIENHIYKYQNQV